MLRSTFSNGYKNPEFDAVFKLVEVVKRNAPKTVKGKKPLKKM
jgi:hypothetical protein